jgi:hypothetical protein
MVTKRNTAVECSTCGAAMVLMRIQPDFGNNTIEWHDFACEICAATATFSFKAKGRPRTS